MAGLITVQQYTTRLGRTLNEAQQAQVEAYIEDASALVRRIADGALDATVTAPPELVPVIVSMVRRGIENPRGISSERIGDYQWTGTGGLYATDEEVSLIRGAAGLNFIREVTLSSDVPDRLLLDADIVPGPPGFDYSDL